MPQDATRWPSVWSIAIWVAIGVYVASPRQNGSLEVAPQLASCQNSGAAVFPAGALQTDAIALDSPEDTKLVEAYQRFVQRCMLEYGFVEDERPKACQPKLDSVMNQDPLCYRRSGFFPDAWASIVAAIEEKTTPQQTPGHTTPAN